MTLLPIVARELRVAARRKATYYMRTFVAGGVITISALVFLMLHTESPKELGKVLFAFVSGTVLFFCALIGGGLTADCLSEEKREGTLGLLFLTDLTGFDVVMGKLASTSVNAFYSLLAVMPVLALPLLLGGVSPGEFQRVVLVCVNTMFLSLTTGLCVSSVSHHARKAIGGAMALMLLLTLGIPVLGGWLDFKYHIRWAETAFTLQSPVLGMIHAFDRDYRTHADQFWSSLILIHLIAWACLGLASRAAKRTWQDRPKSIKPGGWRAAWRTWLLGSATERRALRRRLLRINPFLWRVGRERWRGYAVWLAMAIVGIVWLWGALNLGHDWFGQPSYFVTGFLLMIGLKLAVASEAGHALGQDRWSGALELVLATPLSVGEIVGGQLLALKRQFLAPACVTLGLCFLFLLLTLADNTSGMVGEERLGMVSLWVAGMIVFVTDCAALAVVGMWHGLTQRHPSRAASTTMAWVLGLPWAVYLLGVLWAVMLNRRSPPDWWFFLGLWFVPSLLVDFGFGVWAWRKLHAELRQIVMERQPPRAIWWRWLAGASKPAVAPATERR